MKSFTIDVSKWRTGKSGKNSTGTGLTSLLNEDGYMCCLGFFCRSLGFPEKDMIHVCTPAALAHTKLEIIKDFLSLDKNCKGQPIYKNGELFHKAMQINDSTIITLKEKMQSIRALFKNNGIQVKFKNIPK